MAKSPNQKLKLLYLLDMLMRHTDEEHGMTVAEMISRLAENDISAERKSLYDDLDALRRYGIEIEEARGKQYTYAIVDRSFQLPELKLLIDVVQCAKFLTPKKSSELIQKIESLTSIHQARKLRRQVYVANRVKNENESIYYNVDMLHSAILENKKISFRYFVWTVDPKAAGRISKQYRREGGRYLASPIALTWDDTNYYLIAVDHRENIIKHFRVDKLTEIRIEKEKREHLPQAEQFDTAAYCRSTFGMFGGQEEKVRLRFRNHLIGVVVDRFGDDVFVSLPDSEHFEITVPVKVSPQFWSWLFGFGEEVQVVSPESLARDYRQLLEKTAAAQRKQP